jgi:cell division protein ZapA (FtsZ GTPase activity inhibitor)
MMSVRRTVSLEGLRIELRSVLAEEDLQAALDLVRGRLERLRASSTVTVKDPARLALMAALNLAGELVLERRRGREPVAGGQLELLSERIEARLAALGQENAPGPAMNREDRPCGTRT